MDWVAFDTETTGLGSDARIVEIGARRFCDDGTRWDFQTLVDPEMSIPLVVQRIHGITDAMVEDAPDARRAMQRFFAFAEGAALVAHNARFDARMLAQDAHRVRTFLPSIPVHCSARLARRLLPQMWSYRLSNLTRALNLEAVTFHRALPDATLVGQLMQRLLQLNAADLTGFPVVSGGFVGPLDLFGLDPRAERVDLVTLPTASA